jgi:hypothetical protein
MKLISEASSGKTIVTFKTIVKQGKVSEVPRQPTNAESFLKRRPHYQFIDSIEKEVAVDSAS